MLHRPSVTEIEPPVRRRAEGTGLNIGTFRSLKHRGFRLLFFTIMFTSGRQWTLWSHLRVPHVRRLT